MVRVGEFSDDVCDRLKLKVSMKVTIITEMSTRSRKLMLLGSRACPVQRADNVTSICEPIV
jgi:hypothetical protein